MAFLYLGKVIYSAVINDRKSVKAIKEKLPFIMLADYNAVNSQIKINEVDSL